MSNRRDGRADLVEMILHGLGFDDGQHQRGPGIASRAQRVEQIIPTEADLQRFMA